MGRRIFSRILSPDLFSFLWEKCSEKSSRKIPGKIPQNSIVQQKSPTHFCRGAGPRSSKSCFSGRGGMRTATFEFSESFSLSRRNPYQPPELPRSPSMSFSSRESGWKIVLIREGVEYCLTEWPHIARYRDTLAAMPSLQSIPHIARCFFMEVGTPTKWCGTPPWYLVSHRQICAIPHFAAHRTTIVRYPTKIGALKTTSAVLKCSKILAPVPATTSGNCLVFSRKLLPVLVFPVLHPSAHPVVNNRHTIRQKLKGSFTGGSFRKGVRVVIVVPGGGV